jgi:hypothetical protein
MTHLEQIARRQKRLMATNVIVTVIGCTSVFAALIALL